eukprot:Pgem_evm1s11839
MFLTLYLFWTFYARSFPQRKNQPNIKVNFWFSELKNIACMTSMFIPLFAAYLIAVSRVLDYVHDFS